VSKAKDRYEFVAVLTREIPTLAPFRVVELAMQLMRCAASADRLSVAHCNYMETEEYERKITAVRKRVAKLLVDVPGVTALQVGGDPRGFCLKLSLPSGAYNSWGGKESGFGVPC